MSDPARGLLIKRIPRGGSVDDGQSVYIDVEYEDGNVSRLLCHHSRLGHVMTSLYAAIQMAADDRAKINPLEGKRGDLEDAESLSVQSLGVSAAVGHDAVGLRIQTKQQFAVHISMSADHARGLIEGLTGALEQFPATSKQKPH